MDGVKSRLTGVESQIVQLRGEMREGFSAIRGEMTTQGSDLRKEMAAQGGELRKEMAEQKIDLRQDISALSMEMASLFIASEHKTRLLFEEFLGKRKTIDEGHPDV